MTKINILLLLAFAQVAFAGECQVIAASELAVQASTAAETCRWSDAILLLDNAATKLQCPASDTLEMLTARLAAARLTILGDRAAAASLRREVATLLTQSRAGSAQARIDSANLPYCAVAADSFEVTRRRALAKELMASGDHASNPRQALGLLRDAARLNIETDHLSGRIASAQGEVSRLPCRGCRVVKKTLLTIGITVAIGGGSYYGYRIYQSHQLRRPVQSFAPAR